MDETRILQHLYQLTGITLPQGERQDLREGIKRNGLVNEINTLWETYTAKIEIERRREMMRIYEDGTKEGIAQASSKMSGNGWVWTGAGD